MIFLFTGVVAQIASDNLFNQALREARVQQILPTNFFDSSVLKKINLNFNKATADYIWLSTIQYFGGGNPNLPYESLSQMLFTVVELDPKFEYPYLFGGIILPWQNEPEAGLRLLDKGQKHFPNNGLLYYYAGFIAKLNLNDSERAAGYFQTAVGKKDTPPAARLLAGISLSSLDDKQFAKTWWEGVLESEENESIKERARVWLDYLNTTIELEKIIQLAQQQTGQKISSLQDLVELGYLIKLPQTELGELEYDALTGRVDKVN